MRTTRAWTSLSVTAALVLGGCASGGGTSGPVEWDSEIDLGVPGEWIETVVDVEYYPACGNEVLTFEGDQWHPFTPSNLDDFPSEPRALATAPLGFSRASAVVPAEAVPAVVAPAVVEPGPGDDIGTLSLYEGGFAHWTSRSGGLETWLTTSEIEYTWMC